MRRVTGLMHMGVGIVVLVKSTALLGCGAIDTRHFFDENACEIFNCDTLFFIDNHIHEEAVVEGGHEDAANNDVMHDEDMGGDEGTHDD